MSVDLNVWSNHQLRFTSFTEALEMFELKTGKKLDQRSFKTAAPPETTRIIEEVRYFTDFEALKKNLKRSNKISIFTNFAYCGELSLYGKTVRFVPEGFYTRYSYWKQLVINKLEDERLGDEKLLIEYRKNWRLFREYCQDLTRKLGGDRIIYIDDNFQPQEDKFYEGESLECGIKLMSEICEPDELDLLEWYADESAERYVWYFEELK